MDAARIVRLLPEVYQAAARPGSVLAALLAAMEQQHATAEAVLGALDAVFDPRRAPEPFLRMLANWVGLGSLVQASAAIGQVTGDGTHGLSPFTTRLAAQLRPAAASSASVGVIPTAPSWNDSSSSGASAIAAINVYIGRQRLRAPRAAPPTRASGTMGSVRYEI